MARGGPVLAAKIDPARPILGADRFFRYSRANKDIVTPCSTGKRDTQRDTERDRDRDRDTDTQRERDRMKLDLLSVYRH